MARTLVTGAAGFTGHYLTRLLAEQGDEVHAVLRQGTRIEGDHIAASHEADLADEAAMTRIVADVRPDRVAHLAAISNVAHGDVADMYRTNILGTRTLLDALAKSGTPPRAVLVASSANIYGNNPAGELHEGLPPTPANDYGVTKVATEYVASIFADALPITVVRPFNYTGRGQSTQFLIPKLVDHFRRRAPVIELGNLDVARDFSDVRAVVDTYARLLAREDGGGPWNVCSGEAHTLGSLVERLKRLTGHAIEVKVNPAFVRANEVRRLVGSSARLTAAIGPVRTIPLDDTLTWMLG